MSKTDESIGRNDRGEKLYQVDGFGHPQVLGYGFRIVRGRTGFRLQTRYYGTPRGEFTQEIWADIPVVDEEGSLLGYEFNPRGDVI